MSKRFWPFFYLMAVVSGLLVAAPSAAAAPPTNVNTSTVCQVLAVRLKKEHAPWRDPAWEVFQQYCNGDPGSQPS